MPRSLGPIIAYSQSVRAPNKPDIGAEAQNTPNSQSNGRLTVDRKDRNPKMSIAPLFLRKKH